MNCSYRILEGGVHIGKRVRKTKDRTTVPFDNKPMTGMKLETVSQQGFYLSHESLPKKIWVDFHMLPLTSLKINNGIIEDELTFVEEVQEYGTMVLIKTKTFDYLELLDDLKQKQESIRYGVSDLTPGDRVISCICKNSNEMVYVGRFKIHTFKKYQRWKGGWRSSLYGYGHEKDKNGVYIWPQQVLDRAIFAFPTDRDGNKFGLKSYPVTNKFVKEVYKCEDKGLEARDERFANGDDVIKIIEKVAVKESRLIPIDQSENMEDPLAALPGVDRLSVDYDLKRATLISKSTLSVDDRIEYLKSKYKEYDSHKPQELIFLKGEDEYVEIEGNHPSRWGGLM